MIIKVLKTIKRKIAPSLIAVSTFLLSPVEKIILSRLKKDSVPVVFIVGAPRSGTSLLYELLIRRYKFSYISNLAQMMSKVPVTVTKFGSFFISQYHNQKEDAYNSNYGSINGYGAPSEGGFVWNRWLAETHYLDELYAEKINLTSLKKTIVGLSVVMQGPFLNKNVMHSVHMRVLNVLFPNCLFIHIKRDVKSNVRSILRAHAKLSLSNDNWFSVKPKEYEEFKNENIVLRSVKQVHYVHKNINDDAEVIGKGRVLKIDYELLCEDPKQVLDSIYDFLHTKGLSLKIRNDLIPSLSMPAQNKLSNDVEDAMQEYINRL